MVDNISYKKIWVISYPLILGGVAQNIVSVTDTAFIGKFGGEIPLGAVGNGGIFYMVIIMAGLGFAAGGEILIGRRNGEENYKQIGKVFSHLFYCLCFLGVVIFLFTKFAVPDLIEAVSKSKEIAQYTNEYLDYRAYGILFSFFNFAFRAFYVGITETKVLIINTFILCAINVALDYGLIFGELGLPMMGIAGAALASVIAEAVASLHFVYYTSKINHQKYSLFEFPKIQRDIISRINVIASPIMLRNLIAFSSWLAFFLMIEHISARDLAISHIVKTLYMVLIIPLMGYSACTSTMVSNLIGQGQIDKVLTIIKRISILSVLSSLVMVPLNFLFPETLISFYTNDTTLIADTIPTLHIISGSMIMFSLVNILFSGVIGTGDRKAILLIEIITTIIYLTAAFMFAFHYNLAIELVWSSEYIYFGLMGIMAFIYLRMDRWKKLNL
ncbi:MAG: MATE family efflux transporter [Flavobacteriales bacterium]|nr:MATE family efflux transporter [Flavobacteriales bacterium]